MVVTGWLFRQWYMFVVMDLNTRRIVHTGVTRFPTDEWTAQQLREATPRGEGPKYLIRDLDSKYATHFSTVAMGSGIQELKTPYRTPQANGVCERFMGSLRRECLDHILIHEGSHLERVVKESWHTSIRSNPIKELISRSPITMIRQDQSQPMDGSHRRRFLLNSIIVIPALHI